MKRENFSSRLGFILVSAGCAIGLGNVWKFPYICAQYGGGAFIVIYLVFLAILGLPILITEFAIGRGSGKCLSSAYKDLETERGRFHMNQYFCIGGSYLLMMFYTMVCGWMIDYAYKMATGKLSGLSTAEVQQTFQSMMANPAEMLIFTMIAIAVAFGICALGLNNGVEKISKVVMLILLGLMVILAVHSVLLKNASEGLKYYLVPDFSHIVDNGIGTVIFSAMSHAFFTLSIGIGCMEIFGSYLSKERKLTGEALNIVLLDTGIALTAGLIIIPACAAFDVPLDSGPSLLFISLPNVFNDMNGGRLWGTFFFIFMTFAALTTVIAVFENIIAMSMDTWHLSRKKAVSINIPLMAVLSVPAVLGCNVWSFIQPLGEGSSIMDIEDFFVSNNLLPLGSLLSVLLCTRKHGWGWDNFVQEVNTGHGGNFPGALRGYMTYVLPAIIIFVYLKGYYDMFSDRGPLMLGLWMCIAVLFLALVIYFSMPKRKKTVRV
jgi:NSS family neurotransmitter:Na+ symporter